MYYILEGKIPRKIEDMDEFINHPHQVITVKSTNISDILISTVFLGIDHAFGRGEPILFETMIFGGPDDGAQWRYKTWGEAEEGHKIICKMISEQPEKKIKRHLEF